MRGIDGVEGLQRVAVNDFGTGAADEVAELGQGDIVGIDREHPGEGVRKDMHGDAGLFVGLAQRAILRSVNNRIDETLALQFQRQFELAVRCAFPIQVERAHQCAHGR